MSDRGGIVISGASTGIGEACAVGLAQRGYTVFAGVRREEDGQRLTAEGGHGLVPVILDVTKQETIDATRDTVAAQLKESGQPLRGLFNNAGISVNGPLEFVTVDDLRWQLEVNCVGQLATTQAFIPMLRESKGRIVTTSSVGGFSSTPMLGPYNMSKFAIEAFNDVLRVELAPHGIEVVLLQPASIATKIWDKGIDDSQKFIADAPPEMEQLYGKFLDGVKDFAENGKATAADPKVVLEALVHALESPKPRTRYIMGAGSLQPRIFRRLPDRLRDRLFLKAFGLR